MFEFKDRSGPEAGLRNSEYFRVNVSEPSLCPVSKSLASLMNRRVKSSTSPHLTSLDTDVLAIQLPRFQRTSGVSSSARPVIPTRRITFGDQKPYGSLDCHSRTVTKVCSRRVLRLLRKSMAPFQPNWRRRRPLTIPSHSRSTSMGFFLRTLELGCRCQRSHSFPVPWPVALKCTLPICGISRWQGRSTVVSSA